MPVVASEYRPARLIRQNWLMMAWTNMIRRVPLPQYDAKDRIDLDPPGAGQFVGLHWSLADPSVRRSRAVVICPGLNGGDGSRPVRGMVRAINRAGIDVAVLVYRDTGGAFNDSRETYSGLGNEDLGAAIDSITAGYSYDEIDLVGFSLGGNIILQYLAKCPSRAVWTAVVFSPPIDFGASVEYWSQALLGRGLTRWRWISISGVVVSRMKKRLAAKAKHTNAVAVDDVKAYDRVRTVADADHYVNTEFNRKASATQYWGEANTRSVLREIKVPTLLVLAKDDPVLDSYSYPVPDALSDAVCLELTQNGSHVGFARKLFESEYWSEERAVQWITAPYPPTCS